MTMRAIECADPQRFLAGVFPAMRTRLARISGVHQYQFLAVPLAFVRQHGLDFRPGGIGNGTRQLTVLQKILGFQIFQDDKLPR